MTNQPVPACPAWIDGDPTMEAIAAAVWEQCHTEGSVVVDDPRNIAAVVAAIRTAAGQPAPATVQAALRGRIAEAIDHVFEAWQRGLGDQRPQDALTDAVLSVLPAPVDRTAVLLEAIRRVEDPAERTLTTTGLGYGWEAARDVLDRMATEARQPEPEALSVDVDPVYDPHAWETYHRDAGCGCTAPAPVACKIPHGTGAWLCVCHRLSGPPWKDADPGQPLSQADEKTRQFFQEPNRCTSANGMFRCARPTGHLGDHRMGRTFWSRRPNDDASAVPAAPETEAPPETVHGCPPDGSGLTPCCGHTPFELPPGDRISSEAPTTCTGTAPERGADRA